MHGRACNVDTINITGLNGPSHATASCLIHMKHLFSLDSLKTHLSLTLPSSSITSILLLIILFPILSLEKKLYKHLLLLIFIIKTNKQKTMTQRFFSALILFFAFLTTLVLSAPADACNGFRITSPTQSNLQWTSGQCYQVSYDLGQNKAGSSTVSVDLYSAQTNKKVASLVTNAKTTTLGATDPFNLDAPKTGNYYYRVTFSNGRNCAPKNSVTFHVTYNPHSPPATC